MIAIAYQGFVILTAWIGTAIASKTCNETSSCEECFAKGCKGYVDGHCFTDCSAGIKSLPCYMSCSASNGAKDDGKACAASASCDQCVGVKQSSGRACSWGGVDSDACLSDGDRFNIEVVNGDKAHFEETCPHADSDSMAIMCQSITTCHMCFAAGCRGYANGHCFKDCSHGMADLACYSSCTGVSAAGDDAKLCGDMSSCSSCLETRQSRGSRNACNWGGVVGVGSVACMDDSLRYNVESSGGNHARFATACSQSGNSSFWLGIVILALIIAIIGMICAMVALQRSRANAAVLYERGASNTSLE